MQVFAALAQRLRSRAAVFASIMAIGLMLDQGSKWWALQALASGNSINVVPHVLQLTLYHNPGASFGFGAGLTWLITLIALAASTLLAALALTTRSSWWLVTFAVACAGALGNAIDRVAYAQGFLNGKVVDFLNYGWSIGNVADVLLALAAVLMACLVGLGRPMLLGKAKSAQEPDAHERRELKIADAVAQAMPEGTAHKDTPHESASHEGVQ